MKKIRKAIIPVAGMGTRFLPITKIFPKEMLPIIDKPSLQYIIDEARNSGIEEILLINSPRKKCIEEYFKDNDISYIIQENALGSGHAISLAKDFVGNEPFAVLYGDDLMYNDSNPILKQLINKYNENNSSIIGCLEIEKEFLNRYGIIKLKENSNIIEEIVEKPKIEEAPSNLAGIGRYILNPEIFKYLENLEASLNKEYQLTDAMTKMMKDYNYEICKIDGIYYDIGSKGGYLKANIEYALRRDDIKDNVIDIINNIKEKL